MIRFSWVIEGKKHFFESKSVAVGGDFGGMGSDPMALELGIKSGTDWFIVDEIYEKRMTHLELLRQMGEWNKKYHPEHWWWDPSQEVAIGLLQSYGFPALANKIRDVEFGLRAVFGLIQRGRLHVDKERCPHLWEEFRLYGYALDRTGQIPSGAKPQDRYNHGIDALRYLLTGEGATPPEPKGADLLDVPPMWLDKDGRWHDNQAATIAQRAARKSPDFDTSWWDETGETSF